MKKSMKNKKEKLITISVASLILLLIAFLSLGSTVQRLSTNKTKLPEKMQNTEKEGTYYLSSGVDGVTCK